MDMCYAPPSICPTERTEQPVFSLPDRWMGPSREALRKGNSYLAFALAGDLKIY